MRRFNWLAIGVALAGLSALVEAQTTSRAAPQAYTPQRTPWGDPDLQGAFTNSDESQTPMERPKELEGRRLEDITAEELAKLNQQRNQAREKADEIRWELRSPLHWFENIGFRNSRAWMVTDPPDGRIPYRGASARLRLVERFTPVAPGVLEWAITLDDAETWARPWTFAMNLKQVGASESPFEYACHEGNYAMFNLLSIARAEEAQAAKGAVK